MASLFGINYNEQDKDAYSRLRDMASNFLILGNQLSQGNVSNFDTPNIYASSEDEGPGHLKLSSG